MTPITFEGAVHYFQRAAQDLKKATIKLDEALQVVSDVLVESIDDEILVEYKGGDDAPYSVGILRFDFEDPVLQRHQERLALGIYVREENEREEFVFNSFPLVQLSERGAPRIASRRFRTWAGKNIAEIIQRLSDVVTEETKDIQGAAEASATAAEMISDVDLALLRKFSFLEKKHGGLWIAELTWVSARSGAGAPADKLLAVADTELYDKLNFVSLRSNETDSGEALLFASKQEAEKYKAAIEQHCKENPYYVIDDAGNPRKDADGDPIVAWVPEITLRHIGAFDAAAFFAFGLICHADEEPEGVGDSK